MPTIKAITLWQPWATLIAIGAKRYETRSWGPYHIGPIAIHAASKRDPACLDFIRQEPFRSVLAAAGIEGIHDLPFGAVVAMARLAKVHPVEPLRSKLSAQERAFGDYRDGRKAWELADVKPLRNPIVVSGAQGLWDWEAPEGLLQSYLSTISQGRTHDRIRTGRPRVRRHSHDPRDD